jgi:hypothetical protein
MKTSGIFLILLIFSVACAASAGTVYWQDDPGQRISATFTTIRIPGSSVQAGAVRLEADELGIVRCTSGEASPINFAEDGFAEKGAFSGDKTLFWRDAAGAGAILELNLPVEKKGLYKLALHLGKYRTFGKFQFMVNNKPAGAPVDLFGFPEKDEVVPFNTDLGEVAMNEGDNLFGIKLLGTNDNTVMPNHGACIDWVELTLIETVTTVTGGGGTTGTTGTTISGLTIEADAMPVSRCTSGEAKVVNLAEEGYADEGTFTGDKSLQWHDAANKGALLELRFTVQNKGRYAVTVKVAKYRTYGIHQFLINGKPLGKPVDMFGNPGHDIVTSFTVDLGAANLIQGTNKLGIRLAGTNPATIMANHGAGLDWISLTPVVVPVTTTPTGKK